MMRDAEAHAADDQRRRELIEARNEADSLAYQAEKLLREHEGKFPAELAAEVRERVAAVNAVKDGDDRAAIARATEELGQSVQKLGQQVYSQAAPGAEQAPGGQPGGGQPGPGRKPEGTVEGEFREV
jgi:molecular chaperone DnaK